MKIFKTIFKMGVLTSGLALCALVSAAADQLKPGQWDMTVNMQMKNMPKMSAEDMAKMKEMGVQMPMGGGGPMHVQQCITPEQASLKQPVNSSHGNDGCTVKNYKHSGNKASGEMVCNGDIKATGKFDMTLNGDTSYTSNLSFKGVSKEGQPIDQTTEISGKWVKAKCDPGLPGLKKQ
jgi:hypothetical protein